MKYKIIILLLLLNSCVASNTDNTPKVSFTLSKYNIHLGNHYVISLITFHNDIVALLSNGKIVILDSSYNRNYDAENNINPKDDSISQLFLHDNNIIFMLTNNMIRVCNKDYQRESSFEQKIKGYGLIQGLKYNDTTWFSTTKYVGFLDSAFNFQGKVIVENFPWNHRFIQTEELFKDDSFTVYSCCVGEFGGNTFFVSNTTGKAYSYPATCANNVFKLNGKYYIISSLSHLGYSTEYVSIKAPSNLYETHVGNPADANDPFNCNRDNEALYNYYSDKRTRDQLGINIYYDTVHFITPVTFCYNDKYYSIQIADSCVRIINHDNEAIKVIDTLNVNWRFCAKLYSNTTLSDCSQTSYCSSATSLIVIKGNKIYELLY